MYTRLPFLPRPMRKLSGLMSLDEVLAVDVLDPRDQLVRQQQHCLQAEPP